MPFAKYAIWRVFYNREMEAKDSPRGTIKKWIPIVQGSSHHKSPSSLDNPSPVRLLSTALIAAAF